MRRKVTLLFRFLFDLFHIERQLGKIADEADSHAARLVDCEANCKAISKGQERKNREKAGKETEYQNFDKKVQELDKTIKKIETKDVLRIDVNLEGKKGQLANLEKEIKTLQVKTDKMICFFVDLKARSMYIFQEKAQDAAKKVKPQEKSIKELETMLAQEKSKHQSKDFQATGHQVSKYNTLKQLANGRTHKVGFFGEPGVTIFSKDIKHLHCRLRQLLRRPKERTRATN